jgi:hypothetical protein
MNFTESEKTNMEDNTTLHISYLPFDTTEEDLHYHIKHYNVQSVQISK